MAEFNGHSDLRDQPVGELLEQLSDKTATLVRQELDLAKAELSERASGPGSAPGCSAAPACSERTRAL